MGGVGSVALAARVVLAAVFATAGVAKLFDLKGSRNALQGFGVPMRALWAAAVLLPLAELATAVALLPRASAQWAALAALILTLVFIAAITSALARGKAPDCHCFGQLHSAPAGRATLARNAALAVAAAFVAWRGPGPSIEAWVAARTSAELAAVAFGAGAILLAGLVVRLWRENRGLRRRLGDALSELAAFPSGLPVGARAPGFSLPSVHGETITLEALRARGRSVALVFVSPDCGSCVALFSDLGRWQETLGESLTIAIVSTGSAADNLSAAQDNGADQLLHGGADMLLQKDAEVQRTYRVSATPVMVLVTAAGKIGSAPAFGSIWIESLLRLTLRQAMTFTPGSNAAPSAVTRTGDGSPNGR